MKSKIEFHQRFPTMGKAAGMRRHARNGFTLVELVIVLALMAIMAGMIIPEMKGSMEDSLLRSSGRKIVDLFNMTYSRAISLNEILRVRLDTTTGNYIVERQINDFQGPNAFEPIEDVSGFQGQIDPRIAIEIRPMEPELLEDDMPEEQPKPSLLRNGINFYQDGTTDGCEILLRDRMGVELLLQLDPITAAVRPVERELP